MIESQVCLQKLRGFLSNDESVTASVKKEARGCCKCNQNPQRPSLLPSPKKKKGIPADVFEVKVYSVETRYKLLNNHIGARPSSTILTY